MALTKVPANMLTGVDLGNSVRVNLGNSNNLALFPTGSNGVIHNTTGALRVRANTLNIQDYTNEDAMITANSNGSVDLYHNNQKKFETSAAGATVTGNLTVTGDLDITGNVNSTSVTDLDVTDKTITLGVGQTEANSGGSGIVVDGSSASILWDESNSSWSFSNPVYVQLLRADTLNNRANSANIIYRTGTDTIVGNRADALVVQDDGMVGIGTVAPSVPLHVDGAGLGDVYTATFENTTTDTDHYNAVRWMQGASGTPTGMVGTGGSTTGNVWFRNAFVVGTQNNTDFRLAANDAGKMVIKPNGNIGIGIAYDASPDEKLHISGGGIKVDGAATMASGSGTGIFLDYSSNVGRITALDQGTAWRDLELNAAALQFKIANGLQMFINTSGKVGIKSADPQKNLSIGSSQGEGIQFNFDSTNNYRNQILNYWTSTADTRMDFNLARSSGATPATVMSVGYNSNVGIGTTAPQSGLHIAEGGSGSDGGSVLTLSQTGFGSIVDGDDLGSIHFGGVTSGGVGIHNNAKITVEADGTHASGDYPTRMEFHTTEDGASAPAEKLRITGGAEGAVHPAIIRAADGIDIRSTHYANFQGGGWSSTDTNVNVRKALKEAVFGSYNVNFEPGPYGNGIYYVLAGKKANTANSYIKFKIALNKATHLKINQTVANSADAASRVTSIHYSFDDSTYVQAASAAFGAGAETTTATLDFNSIGTMSGMGDSYSGVFTGNIYIRMRLYLGSSTHETLIGWRNIGFEAKAEDMKLINAGGPQYGPVEAAMFNLHNSSAIVTNNGGFCDLRLHGNSGYMNPEIFEVDTTGNYGIHIKRDGKVFVSMNQDIITTGATSYATSRIYRSPANDANNRVMSYQLITNTNGQWHCIHNAATFDVNAGDRIQFYLLAGNITNVDTTSWSQYNIMWMDSQHSGSGNRAVATYQENAHYDFIG